MANFTTLATRVQDRLIDSNAVITNETGEWINRAIKDLERKHNFPVMREEVAATTVASTRKLVNQPSDWKETRDRPYLRIGQGGLIDTSRIDWAPSLDWLFIEGFRLDDTSETGDPTYILEEQISDSAVEFWLWPFSDSSSQWNDGEYRIVIPYWKFLADLSGTQTNWFTDNAEDYIVAKATAMGFSVNWDDARAAPWEARAAQERRDVITDARRALTPRNMTLIPHRGAGRYATR